MPRTPMMLTRVAIEGTQYSEQDPIMLTLSCCVRLARHPSHILSGADVSEDPCDCAPLSHPSERLLMYLQVLQLAIMSGLLTCTARVKTGA